MRPDAVLIAGPTASGKSAAAAELAERMNGALINTDSMQVYRDFRLLTARPSVAEEAQAPHHLYGHVDGGDAYSTGRWLTDALATINAIHARGATPGITLEKTSLPCMPKSGDTR